MEKRTLYVNGFTLIELLVITAILAVLALITVPRYVVTLEEARIATHNANVKSIKASGMLYIASTGQIPDDMSDLYPDFLEEEPMIPIGLASITTEQYEEGYVIDASDISFNVLPGLIID